MSKSTKKSFKEIYSIAVQEGMSILGEGTALIISHIERKYSISPAETFDNPKILSEALDDTIDGGARVVQRRILRILYEKMSIKQPSSFMTTNFEDKVTQARKDYELAT